VSRWARAGVGLVVAGLVVVTAGCGPDPDERGRGEPPTSVAAGTDASATPDVPGGPVPPVEGATSGGGDQPTLSWDPVEGAVLYSVVVTDAAGEPFWAWQGDGTTATVGDGAPDPSVAPDMTWSVDALDAAGDVVASSERLPLD
jgi:hypothetical protein